MRPSLLPLCFAALAAACRGAPSAEQAREPSPPGVERSSEEGPRVPADARRAPTAGASHRVAWRSEGPLERGKPFALEVWVLEPGGERLARGVELGVDAAMPEHEHGMVRVPTVTALEPGRWRAEGLYFHMLGRWELYLDVTRGARTERASFELWLE